MGDAVDWKTTVRTMLLIVLVWLVVLITLWLVATMPGCATLQGDDLRQLIKHAAVEAVIGVKTETTATANISGTDSIGGTLAIIGLIAATVVCPSPLEWIIRRRRKGRNRDPPT